MLQSTALPDWAEYGLLGLVIVGMGAAMRVLWLAKESRDSYIREQDKANIKAMEGLIGVVRDMYQLSQKLPDDVRSKVTEDLSSKMERVTDILKEIREKLG